MIRRYKSISINYKFFKKKIEPNQNKKPFHIYNENVHRLFGKSHLNFIWYLNGNAAYSVRIKKIPRQFFVGSLYICYLLS